MNTNLDTIYATQNDNIDDFKFDQRVAGVFNDMIRRSVPGYGQIIQTIGDFANDFVKPHTNIYDLGSSLGAATLSVRRNIEGKQCQIFAVDNSESMINRCHENIAAFKSDTTVNLICADIRDIEIANASLVILNFTLQFLPVHDRDALIKKIYQGLNPGGAIVISEKLRFEDDTIQHILDKHHLDFKRANGYSELEISQKRSALENVMLTDTLPAHKDRLNECGFGHVSVWFQCFNFCSMVAIK
ncbi:carboxy-S-adenosyl-L-methionine synthase CmoA [Shewanella intestini]|uniref:Carboxy-S-adenosyl-L-methionine synthase n=1 Tax=Shewanella intestini TaxID=2017544 RepID=A0ABS5I3H3_9GAMM|nr:MULTISPECIES: carboxy-S-adenosyl-L-methionine synthase CmoA [Shewanella]MBR9727880.1 carboxy-S-adenosyl-L-methionine synthase CmoA [Shewanella intestini]MRG36127.1 carboxy-S-adenosyl-L-methionine synthase CmoA [Shewanella sp. XMDDZSB0408]